jgi:hypothetical protein
VAEVRRDLMSESIVVPAEDIAAYLAIVVGAHHENLQVALARCRAIASTLREPARTEMYKQIAQIYGVREL